LIKIHIRTHKMSTPTGVKKGQQKETVEERRKRLEDAQWMRNKTKTMNWEADLLK
jgi:hypothetical protein